MCCQFVSQYTEPWKAARFILPRDPVWSACFPRPGADKIGAHSVPKIQFSKLFVGPWDVARNKQDSMVHIPARLREIDNEVDTTRPDSLARKLQTKLQKTIFECCELRKISQILFEIINNFLRAKY